MRDSLKKEGLKGSTRIWSHRRVGLPKRSQISIFIIIGLVVLISASAFFFLKTRTAVFNPEDITEIHSTPITSYVESCVQKVSVDIIKIYKLVKNKSILKSKC